MGSKTINYYWYKCMENEILKNMHKYFWKLGIVSNN